MTVESPLVDADGNTVKKRGKNVPDPEKRDYEYIPLNEDIKTYFEKEVLPYNPNAWIDTAKTKVGYEIPMTRIFYEYTRLDETDNILENISVLENSIKASLQSLFHKEEM